MNSVCAGALVIVVVVPFEAANTVLVPADGVGGETCRKTAPLVIAGTAAADTCSAAMEDEDVVFQFGYATANTVAVGMMYVGLTKDGV